MSKSMSDRVVVVTGGNSGIGRGAAIALAKAGAKVVIAARREAEGEQTVETIKGEGGDARFVKTDVTQEDQVKALVDRTIADYGRLDSAFNNAGAAKRISLIDMTEQEFDDILAVNLKGVWLCLKYEIKHMLANRSGSIVNMSSGYGLFASPQRVSAYAASKHGVIGLTKAAALEYADSGIRVNAVVPGWIQSRPLTQADAAARAREDQIMKSVPLGRKGTPEEVAEAVVWLCSDASSYVSGHSLILDGGAMAWTGGV